MLAQAEFVHNSKTNRTPFDVVYTKHPNHTINLAILPKARSKAATTAATYFTEMIQYVKDNSHKANNKYKQPADMHRWPKVFKEGDLVMIEIIKEQFPKCAYNKLKPRKLRQYPIKCKFNDNVYLIGLPISENFPQTLMFLIFTNITP